MAKLSDLVATYSKVLGVRLRTVREVARRVREEGHIQTGGRGRGAPDMTAADAAALLLAFMGSRAFGGAEVSQAAENVELFRRLKISQYTNLDRSQDIEIPPPEQYMGLGPHHTFGEAVEALIEQCIHGLPYEPPHQFPFNLTRIQVERPVRSGAIEMYCGSRHMWTAMYEEPEFACMDDKHEIQRIRRLFTEVSIDFSGGLYVQRFIGMPTLSVIGDCLRGGAPNE